MPIAGARGSYGSDNGHEGGRLGRLLRDAAFLIAVNIAICRGAAANIEGHSTAAKFDKPRRLSGGHPVS
jgi:hypothetical protein